MDDTYDITGDGVVDSFDLDSDAGGYAETLLIDHGHGDSDGEDARPSDPFRY